jgi:hypothetical protein
MKSIVYRGSKEICGAVGLNWQYIAEYVERYDFSAFKIDGLKSWFALHEDLEQWTRSMRDIHLAGSKKKKSTLVSLEAKNNVGQEWGKLPKTKKGLKADML